MRSKSLILFTFLFLLGCAEAPLALEENHPQISDAPVEHDVTVYGTMTVEYRTNGQDSSYVCAGEFDVQGWVEEEVSSTDVGCTGCSENYTIAPTLTDTDCSSLRARGAPSIALLDFAFFPHDGSQAAQSTWDFLQGEFEPPEAGSRAVSFGLANWNAIEFSELEDGFDIYFGVYETSGTPDVPSDVTCVRESHLRMTPAVAINSDNNARWRMDLCFTE